MIISQPPTLQADTQSVLGEMRELREAMDTEQAYRRGDLHAEKRILVNQIFRVGQKVRCIAGRFRFRKHYVMTVRWL